MHIVLKWNFSQQMERPSVFSKTGSFIPNAYKTSLKAGMKASASVTYSEI